MLDLVQRDDDLPWYSSMWGRLVDVMPTDSSWVEVPLAGLVLLAAVSIFAYSMVRG